MDAEFADILEHEKRIKHSLGFNISDFMEEYNNIDDLNHDKLRRHIDRIKNDKMRLCNQLYKRVNEELYFFNNCPGLKKYINKVAELIETSDRRVYLKYYRMLFNELIENLTLKHEGLKSETLEKNKQHMKEHASEKIVCQCGAIVSRAIISRHKLTKKHLDNMPLLDTM
jgi:hypothetical protein